MKERLAFRYMAEYSARLGIPAKDLLTSRGNLRIFYPETKRLSRRWLGLNHGSHIQIRTTKRQAIDFKQTIAHELIHSAFPKLRHGKTYENHVQALLNGNLFFDGQRKIQHFMGRELYKIGTKGVEDLTQPAYYYIPRLVTKFPKPKQPLDKKLAKVQTHIKQLETRTKRLQTVLKKWRRKEHYLLKQIGEVKA